MGRWRKPHLSGPRGPRERVAPLFDGTGWASAAITHRFPLVWEQDRMTACSTILHAETTNNHDHARRQCPFMSSRRLCVIVNNATLMRSSSLSVFEKSTDFYNEATHITDTRPVTTYKAGSPVGARRRPRAGLSLPKRCARSRRGGRRCRGSARTRRTSCKRTLRRLRRLLRPPKVFTNDYRRMPKTTSKMSALSL